MKKRFLLPIALILALALLLTGCAYIESALDLILELANEETTPLPEGKDQTPEGWYAELPAYTGQPYATINNNHPFFTDSDKASASSFETYGDLDGLGRCTAAYANLGKDLMPTDDREEIGSVKPTGWVSASYDFISGKYLYNRCHLIGFQLAGENANEKNLITGTRYLNVTGMLPFENMVADYIKETNNHVLYRVTPVFDGQNLVAAGVLMEAWSVEDDGDGIEFCIFCYNVQPGVIIDYATGQSRADEAGTTAETTSAQDVGDYVLNTSSKRFHLPTCSSVTDMKEANKEEYHGSRQHLIDEGYSPCSACKP